MPSNTWMRRCNRDTSEDNFNGVGYQERNNNIIIVGFFSGNGEGILLSMLCMNYQHITAEQELHYPYT